MDWDNGRQLQSFTKDNVTTTYKYNSDGMRTYKNSSDGNTQYYYDGNNNLIALCYTPTTGTKKVLNFFYDSEGSPVSFQVNSLDKYFYVKNLQGDIEKIVDVFGEVLVTYTYDAWGNILSVTDNSTNNLSTLNPLRYRGYAYDTESGFYYLQSRYYDPQTGRFLNADETEYLTTNQEILGKNLYAYCSNNFVNDSDETGNISMKTITGFFNVLTKVLGKIIDFAKVIVNSLLNLYTGLSPKDISSIAKDIGRSPHRVRQAIASLLSKLKNINSYIGKFAIAISVLTMISSLGEKIVRLGDIASVIAEFVIEAVVSLVQVMAKNLLKILSKVIPYVGWILSVFAGPIASVLVKIVFNQKRLKQYKRLMVPIVRWCGNGMTNYFKAFFKCVA